MDYSPWSWKNLIDWNRFKKFMQIGIDVKCMHTSFGGRGYFGLVAKIFLNFLLDHICTLSSVGVVLLFLSVFRF